MTLAHKRAIAKGLKRAHRRRKKYYRRASPELSTKERELMVCQKALEILDKIINAALV